MPRNMRASGAPEPVPYVQPTKLTKTLEVTCNLGAYESVRIGVSVEAAVYSAEGGTAAESAALQRIVEDMLREDARKVLGEVTRKTTGDKTAGQLAILPKG